MDIAPCILGIKIWEGVLSFREEKVQRIQEVSASGHVGVGIYVLPSVFCKKYSERNDK